MSNVAKPWPSYSVLDNLVDKASGQFIYPATVLKFVGDPNYRPTARLDIITSMPVISPSALAQKPLAALDQLYSQILSTSSDKQRTLDILCAIYTMQISESIMPCGEIVHVEFLRIAEKLLSLQPGDGPQALRKIRSLVHIPERLLVLDDADANLPLPECCCQPEDEDEDEIRFHHKSFTDYLKDPSRSLEYFVDMEEMQTRLGLACIVTMQNFSLQPTPSRIACITWGYAMIFWTNLVGFSGVPKLTLLQALMSFDILACYLNTWGFKIGFECLDTIKRVAFPSSSATVISKIAEKLCSKKNTIDKTCPNLSDIKVAQEFLFSVVSPGGRDLMKFDPTLGLGMVLNWLQTNPDSPPELIRQYQEVVNVLDYFWRFPDRRPAAVPNDDYFRNMHKPEPPRFSIVDSWTNVKELLKLLTSVIIEYSIVG